MTKKKGICLLVAPCAKYRRKDFIDPVLSEIHEKQTIDTLLVTDEAGVSFYATLWAAYDPNITVMTFGKENAKYVRNEKMFEIGKPSVVVAFCGDDDTADVVEMAKKRGIGVILVS